MKKRRPPPPTEVGYYRVIFDGEPFTEEEMARYEETKENWLRSLTLEQLIKLNALIDCDRGRHSSWEPLFASPAMDAHPAIWEAYHRLCDAVYCPQCGRVRMPATKTEEQILTDLDSKLLRAAAEEWKKVVNARKPEDALRRYLGGGLAGGKSTLGDPLAAQKCPPSPRT